MLLVSFGVLASNWEVMLCVSDGIETPFFSSSGSLGRDQHSQVPQIEPKTVSDSNPSSIS
ncbi:hypothetical protein GBA52_027687 [Prunus armeniaca]|nr:hypothetical protein GBA52_027687 [Prunus armeniaca]